MELLKLLNDWSNEAVFEKECSGYSGFAKVLGSP